MIRQQSNAWATAAWMLAPTLFFLVVFTYGPGLYNIASSLPGFPRLFSNPANRNLVGVTLSYMMLVVPGSVLLGLGSALLVDGRTPARVMARAVLFHPVLLPPVAFAAVWLYLLNPVSSPIQPVLRWIMGGQGNILGSSTTALVAVALIGILKQFGLYMLYFLAGLQGIPVELKDAAAMDGANRWQIFWRVVLPLLGPTMFFVGTVALLDGIKSVDHIFVLTKGGPSDATNILLYRIFVLGFEYYDVPQAAALTTVLLTVLTLIALLTMPKLEKRVHYYGD
jgi:sn-glycerol 3-phosphate transport system permease protein